MDNRIANDMISSGMIPSGEKKKEDLSRTQYGSAPSPSKLMDAYKSMYEHHKKDADGNTIPHEGEELNEIAITGTLAALKGLGTMAAKLGVKAGAKLGGKAGANMMKSVARNPMKAVDNINRVGYAAQTVGNLMPKPSVPAVTKKQSQGGMVSADVDLFDIVKGQLLDEGLSEEEIKDIMLTLTPDEIMEELSDIVKRNDALNKERAMKAAQERREKSTPPKEVTDAAKRQYKAGSPGAEPYTTADKKTIINYNKDK